jgi:ribonuclease BN (tRNA processing enzyme)
VLFDTGDGVLRDLLVREMAPEALNAIFFTHGHYDHMGGLHSLLGYMRAVGRAQPLPVYIPADCFEVKASIDTFERCYPASVPFEIKLTELQPRQSQVIADVTVEPYPMVHSGSIVGADIMEAIPAVGYRVTCGDESVAITGDTGRCRLLEELVQDVDLAIIEATFESSRKMDRQVLEKVHLSEDVAREIGRLAREYILVHKGSRT